MAKRKSQQPDQIRTEDISVSPFQEQYVPDAGIVVPKQRAWLLTGDEANNPNPGSREQNAPKVSKFNRRLTDGGE